MTTLKGSLFCGLILIIVALLGCSESFNEETGIYSHTGKGFSIQFPTGWDKIKASPFSLVSFANKDQAAQIEIAVADMPENLTFDQYIKQTSSQARRMGYQQRDRGVITIDDIEGDRSIWGRNMGGELYISISYTVMQGERVYRIVCVSKAKDFTDNENIFDDVVKSFRFTS